MRFPTLWVGFAVIRAANESLPPLECTKFIENAPFGHQVSPQLAFSARNEALPAQDCSSGDGLDNHSAPRRQEPTRAALFKALDGVPTTA